MYIYGLPNPNFTSFFRTNVLSLNRILNISFSRLLSPTDILKKKTYRNTIEVSIALDPDKYRHNIRTDGLKLLVNTGTLERKDWGDFHQNLNL